MNSLESWFGLFLGICDFDEHILTPKGEKYMDKNKRKELLEEYKQIKTYMGIIQITNKTNGKIYVEKLQPYGDRGYNRPPMN